jgi:hypothetical protein
MGDPNAGTTSQAKEPSRAAPVIGLDGNLSVYSRAAFIRSARALIEPLKCTVGGVPSLLHTSLISSLRQASHDSLHATSRSDQSDKNGLATERKSRRKAVFAWCAQHGTRLEVQVLLLSYHRD